MASILAEEDRDGGIASRSEVARALQDPRCILLLAIAEERPVGLLSAHVFPDAAGGGWLAYLYDIEVLAARRRGGIGKELIQCLKQECSRQGVRLIWAGTDEENRAARLAFEHTGAELEGDGYAEYEWDLSSPGGSG